MHFVNIFTGKLLSAEERRWCPPSRRVMSLVGTSWTSPAELTMSVLRAKADLTIARVEV
jgi:hypothetical protein